MRVCVRLSEGHMKMYLSDMVVGWLHRTRNQEQYETAYLETMAGLYDADLVVSDDIKTVVDALRLGQYAALLVWRCGELWMDELPPWLDAHRDRYQLVHLRLYSPGAERHGIGALREFLWRAATELELTAEPTDDCPTSPLGIVPQVGGPPLPTPS